MLGFDWISSVAKAVTNTVSPVIDFVNNVVSDVVDTVSSAVTAIDHVATVVSDSFAKTLAIGTNVIAGPFDVLQLVGTSFSAVLLSGGTTSLDANRPVSKDVLTPNRWYEVTLPKGPDSGCGDGSEYRFYINKGSEVANLLIAFEGGGACWDYESCSGEGGAVGASNPNGLPSGYLTKISGNLIPLAQRVSPIMNRVGLGQKVETQKWTQVYLPYCTGDMHAGNASVVYGAKFQNAARMQNFSGLRNVVAVLRWLRINKFNNPNRMMVWGMSAGGYGATLNYALIRRMLNPSSSTLLNDAGTIFITPFTENGGYKNYSATPSVGVLDKISSEWNLMSGGSDGDMDANKLIDRIESGRGPFLSGILSIDKRLMPDLNVRNIGSIYAATANEFPRDRLGFTTFQQDSVIPDFAYSSFVPAVREEVNSSVRTSMQHDLFHQELAHIRSELDGIGNFGYFMPWAHHGFAGDHTVTVLFNGSEIVDGGRVLNVGDFANDLLSGADPKHSPVMKRFEADRTFVGNFDFTSGLAAFFEKLFSR